MAQQKTTIINSNNKEKGYDNIDDDNNNNSNTNYNNDNPLFDRKIFLLQVFQHSMLEP